MHMNRKESAAEGLKPFVKWAGGKKQLLTELACRMPESYGRYYEPFIGGGALLLHVCPKNAVICDVNSQLLNVYRQLAKDAGAVIAKLDAFDAKECDEKVYMAMRERYNAMIAGSVLDAACAALMIWINKHCFNGLYRVNAKGLFNVPFNNRTAGTSMDAENLRSIGSYLSTGAVEIREGDFAKALCDVRAGDFVYLDSPYIPVSSTANFTSYAKTGFAREDHERLAREYRRLDALGAKVMLSNNDVPLVHELYAGFSISSIGVRRAINRDASARRGREVIVTNYQAMS